MNTGSFSPADRIVIPVEGTDREYLAQQWAVELAAALDLPLRAIHISPGTGEERSDTFAYIEKIAKKHDVAIETEVIHGQDIVQELVDDLETRDLVIIGTRKLAHHYHVGSVAAELVEKAPCPVQVVRIE